MSSDSAVNGVEDKRVSVKEHIVDYSNDTAGNVTIDNENNGSYILGSDNSHHSMLSSPQQSTSISISTDDGSVTLISPISRISVSFSTIL